MPKDESSSQDTEVKLLPAPMKSSYAFQFPDVNKNRYKDAEPHRQTAAREKRCANTHTIRGRVKKIHFGSRVLVSTPEHHPFRLPRQFNYYHAHHRLGNVSCVRQCDVRWMSSFFLQLDTKGKLMRFSFSMTTQQEEGDCLLSLFIFHHKDDKCI